MAKKIAEAHPKTKQWLKKIKKQKKTTRIKKKNKPIETVNFTNYLKGSRWQELKTKHLNKYSQCLICEKDTNLHVHHIKYNNLGKKHEINDLITLCATHHHTLHVYCKIHNLTVIKGTEEYLSSCFFKNH